MRVLSSLIRALGGTGFIFLMSLAGSAAVFFMASRPGGRAEKAVSGFAAGIMSAAAVWSLILPAIERTEAVGRLPGWLPAALGLLAGAAFLCLPEKLPLPGLSRKSGAGSPLLFTAITLHNIPEGMAVGLAFALAEGAEGLAAASALALGIGVQNLPEGAAVSLPLRQRGMSRGRAFAYGAAAGAVEPVFGLLAVLAAAWAQPLMPWLLSFAAGAMLFVSARELVPEASGPSGSLSYILGFALMMTLDVALG